MKTTIICTVMMAFAICALGQQDNSKPPMTSQEYLTKSKEQKTAAWISVGTGTVLLGTGYLVALTAAVDDGDPTGGLILFGAGALMDLISIPLFISSGKNKRRAKEALTYIKIEQGPSGPGYTTLQTAMPAVAVKVKF
jgi:hypothetical protein